MGSVRQAAAARAGIVRDTGSRGTHTPKIARSAVRENQRWAFGFRFFREIKNFGLDSSEVDKKWMLSAIYRLQELCALPVSQVMEDVSLREGTLRIHDIDWNWKNVPIARKDLDWIDEAYRHNEAEYPIFQVAVSKAEGRLVGFLDEDNVFQIVLLDPLHNAQPSKYNDYKVRLSKPLGCEVTSIRYDLSLAIEKSRDKGCDCHEDLTSLLDWRRGKAGVAIVMPLVKGTELEDADQLIAEGYAETYVDVFAAGLVALLEKRKPA